MTDKSILEPKEKIKCDMNPEEFRKYGYQIIDWISNYISNIENYPVLSQVKPGEIKNTLPKSPPKNGEQMEKIIGDFEKLILPGITHWNHPGFHAYFAISASMPGILGELLTASLNQQGMLWKTSPSCTELEQVVLDYLRQMLGLPDNLFGIIYDYASTATLCAIAAARESLNLKIREEGMCGRNDLQKFRLYSSTETHSSIEKAAVVLGIGQKNVRKIKVNDRFEMKVDELEKAIEEDKKAGYLPFCVVATIGTTSTTSIDPVPEIAKICKKHNIWLHVDGAYGLNAAIVPEMKHIKEGCSEADSIVLNPHKWLLTPQDLSAFYTRKPEILKRTFSLVPEYLKTSQDEKVVNYMDYGIQLGRRFRALKLWMIIKYFGHEGLASIIREHIRLAKLFASWVENDSDFELLAPVPFAVVCFRFKPKEVKDENKLNELNEKLMNTVNESGKIYISHTKLNGKFTLRFSVGNIRTTEDHIRDAWKLLKGYHLKL